MICQVTIENKRKPPVTIYHFVFNHEGEEIGKAHKTYCNDKNWMGTDYYGQPCLRRNKYTEKLGKPYDIMTYQENKFLNQLISAERTELRKYALLNIRNTDSILTSVLVNSILKYPDFRMQIIKRG